MPGRKSGGSVASAADDSMSVEDYNLPKTMVQRLAKGVLPPNTQISKDALLAISKSATVFVNYLASHANDNTTRQNKKTIQPADVLLALKEIEFDTFEVRCAAELEKYNNAQCDKRNTYRRRVKEEARTTKPEDAATEGVSGGEEGAVGDVRDEKEKARLERVRRRRKAGKRDPEGESTDEEGAEPGARKKMRTDEGAGVKTGGSKGQVPAEEEEDDDEVEEEAAEEEEQNGEESEFESAEEEIDEEPENAQRRAHEEEDLLETGGDGDGGRGDEDDEMLDGEESD